MEVFIHIKYIVPFLLSIPETLIILGYVCAWRSAANLLNDFRALPNDLSIKYCQTESPVIFFYCMFILNLVLNNIELFFY